MTVTTARRPRTLYRQVLGHGVRLLLAVGAALVLAGAALGHAGLWRPHPTNFAQHVGVLLKPLDETAARAQLAALADALEVDLALYRDDGSPLAKAGAMPQDPLTAREVQALRRQGVLRGGPLGATAVAGDGRYLRLRYRSGGGALLLRTLGFVGLLVAALGIASIPFARAIARPIESLASAARRLGAGDLQARAALPPGDQIGELGHAFDEMAERLGQLVTGQRELLAGVSHELRTPLARVRVALALAAEAPPEQVPTLLHDAERDVTEIERLIDTLLTTSRLDAQGRFALRSDRVEVGAIVAAAHERFRRHHPDREIELATAEDLGALVVEESLLARALDNLLDNAARFSDSPQPVHLTARATAAEVVFEVVDHGIGMSALELARAGTPFFRADESRARRTGGVGLGLALARRIVEAHGGRLTMTSRPGAGTTMAIALPHAT